MNYQILFPLCALLLLSPCDSAATGRQDELKQFPDGFKFGAATAAYQVEGAWNIGGRTPGIWDYAVHNESWRIANGDTGDVACDSYHNYKRDVEMLRELGLHFYRFSISWPRILPNGFANEIAEDGVTYYNNLIDELLTYDIEPVVTIYHWDLPQSLQRFGGWANPLSVTWLKDFSRVVFELFGDRVKTWVTINEAHQICAWGYGIDRHAPFLHANGIGNYLCTYNILKAHAAIYHLYDKEFRSTQGGRIGYVVNLSWGEAASDSDADTQAADEYRQFMYGLYAHPIYHADGDFPPFVKSRVAARSAEQGFPRSRLPEFTAEEVDYIKGTADFFGINHYTTSYVYRNDSVIGIYASPSMDDDINTGTFYDSTWEAGAGPTFRVVPWGFRRALNFIKDSYGNVEVIVLENGFPSTGGLDDDSRINYHRLYLLELLDAIHEDGVNVTAYTVWSLMDNFSWDRGYTFRYGLYQVDFDDDARPRTPRKSAAVYKEIVRSGVVDLSYEPDSYDISID